MSKNAETIYNPTEDVLFKEPYIDVEEWKERKIGENQTVSFLHVHGGFRQTNVKFSFCFPKKEEFEGRFFQFLSPFPGPDEEMASFQLTEEDDKIAFAVTHGAYFVETNMGSGSAFGVNQDPTLIYKSSAAAAEYSRIKAQEIYGEQRIYGYVYGGSGGGYKTMSCMENTGAWDGGVPYIIGSPVAIPNCQTTRVHGLRVLRNAFPKIVAALEPGGSKNIYEGLTEEEKEALQEVTRMGMPPRSWFWYEKMDDGSLPVLAPIVKMQDPGYFKDFWEVKGYLGAEPDGSARKDRIQLHSKIKEIHMADEIQAVQSGNGADEAFKKMLTKSNIESIELEDALPGQDPYLRGLQVTVESGEAKNSFFAVENIQGTKLIPGATFGAPDLDETLGKLKVGDTLLLDNSDYIAIQTYHRHQVPAKEYRVWDQFRDEYGNPIYPQRVSVLGEMVAMSGAGSIQSGDIQGKVIVVASIMDESAFPWQPDWYLHKVKEQKKEEFHDMFRLWYVDHSLHDDREGTVDELHFTSYCGALRQAILDLSAWVEKGIEPAPTSHYEIVDGQVILPESAKNRKGITQVVTLTANRQECAVVKAGEEVLFRAEIEVPQGLGAVTKVEWSFDGEQEFKETSGFSKEGELFVSEKKHAYREAGIHYAVVRVKMNRVGDVEDIFTQIKEIKRVAIHVK
jgi:hypothetical protein